MFCAADISFFLAVLSVQVSTCDEMRSYRDNAKNNRILRRKLLETRLMYYLNCVCTSIDCNQDEDIRRFTNYANWSWLSAEEHKVLLLLCYTFSPDVFDGKVFFNIEELCIEFANEFYEINQIRDRLVAVESIIIAGRAHHVTKIMVYKMAWMRMYYLEPMQRLARRFAGQSSSSTYQSSSNDSECCCCTIL